MFHLVDFACSESVCVCERERGREREREGERGGEREIRKTCSIKADFTANNFAEKTEK